MGLYETKFNEADFIANHRNVIEVPEVFDAIKIPGVINYWREYHRNTYATGESRFNLLALGFNGASVNGLSNLSQQEAIRRALEICEVYAKPPLYHLC